MVIYPNFINLLQRGDRMHSDKALLHSKKKNQSVLFGWTYTFFLRAWRVCKVLIKMCPKFSYDTNSCQMSAMFIIIYEVQSEHEDFSAPMPNHPLSLSQIYPSSFTSHCVCGPLFLFSDRSFPVLRGKDTRKEGSERKCGGWSREEIGLVSSRPFFFFVGYFYCLGFSRVCS